MIDTFAISKTLARPPNECFLLEQNWKRFLFDSKGNCFKYTLNKKDSLEPRLTLTKRPDGWWSLRAEVSLGSWLYGSNLHLPNEKELAHGLVMLSQYVESKSGIVFEAQTERVTRVDFTRDFKVDENLVVPIIAQISKMSLPKYNRQPTNDTTVYFRNAGKERSRDYKIYSKYHERLANSKNLAEQEKAKSIIRLEIAIWNNAVGRLATSLKLPDHRANYILTKDASSRVIQKAMSLLEIEKIIGGETNNILKLFEIHPLKMVKEIITYLYLRERFGEDLHNIPTLKLSKRTCQRYWKRCKELGVITLE